MLGWLLLVQVTLVYSLGWQYNSGLFFGLAVNISGLAGIFNSEGWHIMSEVKGPNL